MTEQIDPVHGHEYGASRHGMWTWTPGRHGEHFRRCSYCGSIHPDDLVAEPSWRADWADRKYGYPHKFYVEIVNRDPERLYVIGSTNHIPEPGALGYKGWKLVADLSGDDLAALDRDYPPELSKYRPTGTVQLGPRPTHFGKFYTMHLADPAVSQETKDEIARVSGLKFTFLDDGRIGWESVPTETSDASR